MPNDDPRPTDLPAWLDRDQPWWAKLRRANAHLRSLDQAIREFQGTAPWHVEARHDDAEPGQLAYHFRVDAPFPSELSTIIGDVVHNLRSALESVVFALVVETVGPGNLTEHQEKVTTYPIYPDPAAFDAWLDRGVPKSKPQTVRDLFTEAQILGLQSVQPFAFAQKLAEFGMTRSTTPEHDLVSDAAYRLNQLWNLDKHRTLIGLTWHQENMYWTRDGLGWLPEVEDGSPLTDGQLLGHFRFPDGTPVTDPGVRFTLSPALADDPFPWRRSVQGDLSWWHQTIGGWMVPRVFMTIEAGEPPLLIPPLQALYM